MKKLSISLMAIFGMFISFSFASPSLVNPSYSVNGDDVKIFRTDNSDGGYVDIAVQDPKTKDYLHFGEVKMSDGVFTYTKQWDGDQHIWMTPGDGGDEVKFTVTGDQPSGAAVIEEKNQPEETGATRTVIPVVPKTGPSASIIGIILAALAIFGGYIYIKKRADI